MEYFNLVNQTELKFYKKFIPVKDLKFYEIQANIISSSILLLMLEKVLLKSNKEILEVRMDLSKRIDELILADKEIINFLNNSNLYENESDLRFASLAISNNIIKFKKLNIAIAEGTFKNVIQDLEGLFYATYIEPLNDYDEEEYFSRWASEFLKYKEIFLSDYQDHTSELRRKLLSA